MTVKRNKEQTVPRRSIFETLKSEIRGGKYLNTRRFPSEMSLAQRFGCSRQSVVHALMSLQDLGLVSRERGSGTYLTKKAARYGASIGLIVPGIGCGEIFPPICREISRLAQEEGFSLLFGGDTSSSAAVRAEHAKDLARQFVSKHVAGVIFQPMEFFADSDRFNCEIVSIFEAAKIPVVLIDCDIVSLPERSACDVVGVDNFSIGITLARHMLAAGARRVRVLRKPLCAKTVLDRIRGVQTVLGAKNVEDFTLTAEPDDRKTIARALAGRHGADAFICGNDTVAARLLVTLRKLGKRVPDDVLVTGVDDREHAELVTPALTTVHQPCEAIAATAFGFLLSRLDRPDLSPRTCYLPAPLVIRGSTKRKNVEWGLRVRGY